MTAGRPGHSLAAGLAMIAALTALALALRAAGAGNPLPTTGPTGEPEAGVDGAGSTAPGGGLDVDFEQLIACGAVEPATESSDRVAAPRVELAGASAGGSGRLRRTTRRVAARIERLRGLSFTQAIDAAFLDDEALTSRIAALSRREAEPGRAELEQRALVELGAVPPDADLGALQEETLEGQIAGLYAPRSGELLVRSGAGAPGPIEVLTLAHELEHALADQALGLPVAERPDPRRSDRYLARLALVEGDATLTMQLYSTDYVSLADQLSLLGDDAVADSGAQLADLPDFLQRQLIFPYADGLSYVCERAAEGGIAAIDRAYRRPPRSSWEIMFPDRAPAGRPLDPHDPGRLGGRWRRAGRTQLGAAELSWLFAAPGGDRSRALDDPEDAAAGWAGGELELWTAGERSAVGISLAARGGGLCRAVGDWYRAAAPEATVSEPEAGVVVSDGPDRDAVVSCERGSVRVGIAPEMVTAQALVAPG